MSHELGGRLERPQQGMDHKAFWEIVMQWTTGRLWKSKRYSMSVCAYNQQKYIVDAAQSCCAMYDVRSPL